MIRFKVRGEDIQRITRKLRALGPSVRRNMAQGLQAAGQVYVDLVIQEMGTHVSGGPFGWKPLSDVWLSEKVAQGLVEEIWEATGLTKSAVKVHRVEVQGNRIAVFAGIDGSTDPEAFKRALRTEFGVPGDKVPSRPLFIPTSRKLGTPLTGLDLQSEAGQAVVAAFRRAISEVWGS